MIIWRDNTIASSVLTDALLSAIMADLVAGKWASEIASQHNVTVELVFRLAHDAESTAICQPCKGAGTVNTTHHGEQRCSECGASGWIGKTP